MKGARKDPQVSIRMPQGLKDWLAHKAIDNRRSLNSEIVARLDQTRSSEESATKQGEKE